MGKKDARVDAYISNAADFARPILLHIRRVVHAACPDVEETMKWSFPHFDYKGMMCGMAAFKQHCVLGFWKGQLIFGGRKGAGDSKDDAMGQFGRLTSLADLPNDSALAGHIREAMRLNDEGITVPRKRSTGKKKELIVPDDLVAALKKNKKAQATFENFSYSHKKEYVEWITEAKRPETRTKRLQTTVEWLTHGKSRNWKYTNC